MNYHPHKLCYGVKLQLLLQSTGNRFQVMTNDVEFATHN